MCIRSIKTQAQKRVIATFFSLHINSRPHWNEKSKIENISPGQSYCTTLFHKLKFLRLELVAFCSFFFCHTSPKIPLWSVCRNAHRHVSLWHGEKECDIRFNVYSQGNRWELFHYGSKNIMCGIWLNPAALPESYVKIHLCGENKIYLRKGGARVTYVGYKRKMVVNK